MINVIGLGYIGLPTALMMAAHGVEIVGTPTKGLEGSLQEVELNLSFKEPEWK